MPIGPRKDGAVQEITGLRHHVFRNGAAWRNSGARRGGGDCGTEGASGAMGIAGVHASAGEPCGSVRRDQEIGQLLAGQVTALCQDRTGARRDDALRLRLELGAVTRR